MVLYGVGIQEGNGEGGESAMALKPLTQQYVRDPTPLHVTG